MNDPMQDPLAAMKHVEAILPPKAEFALVYATPALLLSHRAIVITNLASHEALKELLRLVSASKMNPAENN